MMDNKVRFPKHQRMVKRRKWQPKSSDETSSERRWTWFFQGFGVGFAVVSFIAGLIWVIVPPGPPEPPPAPQVYVVPDRLIAAPGDEVTLTPVAENMEPPISIVWAADSGEGLPQGWATATTVNWTAPEDMRMAYITATAKDSKQRVAYGELALPVFPPK